MILLTFSGLVIMIPFVLDFKPINQKVTKEITAYLTEKTNTKIGCSGFSVLYPHTLDVYDVYVEDDFQDTLFMAESFTLDIFEPDLRNNVLKANECAIKNALVKIRFTKDGKLNFEKIISAFRSDNADTSGSKLLVDLSGLGVNLQKIRFEYQDLTRRLEIVGSVDSIGIWSSGSKLEDLLFKVRTGKIINLKGKFSLDSLLIQADIRQVETQNLEINVAKNEYFADYTNFTLPFFSLQKQKDSILLVENLVIRARTSGYFDGSIESDVWMKHLTLNHIEFDGGMMTGFLRKDSLRFDEFYLSQQNRHICLTAEASYDSLEQVYKDPLHLNWKNFNLDAIIAGDDINKLTPNSKIKKTDTLHIEFSGRDSIDFFLIESLKMNLNKQDQLRLKTKWNKQFYLEDFLIKQGYFDLSVTESTLKRFDIPIELGNLKLWGEFDGRYQDFKSKVFASSPRLNTELKLSRKNTSVFFVLKNSDFSLIPDLRLRNSTAKGEINGLESLKNLSWHFNFELDGLKYQQFKFDRSKGSCEGNLEVINLQLGTKTKGLAFESQSFVRLKDFTVKEINTKLQLENFESYHFLHSQDSMQLKGGFELQANLQNGLKGFLKSDSLRFMVFSEASNQSDVRLDFNFNDSCSSASLKTKNIAGEFYSTYALDSILPRSKKFIRTVYRNEVQETHQDSMYCSFAFQDVNHFLPLISKKITSVNLNRFDFSLNERTHKLTFDLDIPEIVLEENKVLKDIKASVFSQNSPFDYNIEVDNIILFDTLETKKLKLFGLIRKDELEFDFQNINSDTLLRYDIKAKYLVQADKKSIVFDSSCVLNYTVWDIQNKLNSTYPSYEFVNKNQILNASFLETENTFLFSNLNETSLFPVLFPVKFKLSGEAHFPSTPTFQYHTTLKLKDVSYQQDTIGDLNLSANSTHKKTHTGTFLFSKKESQLEANWVFDSTAAKGKYYVVNLKAPKLKPELFENFTKDFVKDINGYVYGNATIVSDENFDPKINGQLRFKDLAFRVNELGTPTKVKSGSFLFDNKKMTTNDIVLEDSLQQLGKLTGLVSWENPQNIRYDLQAVFENFMIFNKPDLPKNNPYGGIKLNSTLTISGDQKESNTKATISVLEGSSLGYRVEQNSVASNKGYDDLLEFVDFGDTLNLATLDTILKSKYNNLEADIRIDDQTLLKIILDPLTGDYLTARGGGKLHVSVKDNKEPVVTGKLVLQEGEYKMTFYEVASRKLSFNSGSEIIWQGKLAEPLLTIKTSYTTEASPYPIVRDQVAGSSMESVYKESRKFKLNMDITGSVQNPKMSFSFEYIDPNNAGKQEINQSLAEINAKENSLNQQVFSFLLLNSFTAPNNNVTTRNAINPMDNLSSLMSAQLNSISKQYIKNVDIDWKMGSADKTNTTGQVYRQSNMGVSVKKQLMNDRVTLVVGGGIEYKGSQSQTTSQYVRNASVEISITEDGRFKLRFYSKNDQSYLGERIVDSGVSVVYSKQYEKFSDLFDKKKSKQESTIENEK